MPKKPKRRKTDKKGFVFDSDFLMKLVMTLVAAYVTFVVTSFKMDMREIKEDIKEVNKQFTSFVIETKPKIAILEDKIRNLKIK
jgi:hypothetical protein